MKLRTVEGGTLCDMYTLMDIKVYVLGKVMVFRESTLASALIQIQVCFKKVQK